MPFALNRDDRSVLLAGGGVFLVLVIVGLALAPTADTDEPSSYSAASGGLKATFLLVKELGYQTDRWERAPADLTSPQTTTIIVAEPMMADAADRDVMLRFVEAGGRLIVTGQHGATLVGLSARVDELAGHAWKPAPAVSVSHITRAAAVITLAPATRLIAPVKATPIYAIGGEPAVVHERRNQGDIYWWASATPLTNAGISSPGNLAFLLATLGTPGGRRVLFDEYFHGYRETLTQSLMLTPLKWVLAQIGVIAALVIATYARRSGPVLPGAQETRLSPLEFVHTMGELYRRAHAGSVAVSVAYVPFRSALLTRFGIRSSADAVNAAAAAAKGRPVDPAALAKTMRACEATRDGAQLRDREALALVQALHDRSAELGLTLPFKETR